MWTFAHVVAALLFGGLVWGVSEVLIEPRFPEGFDPGLFAEVNAAIAAFCGWSILGSRAAGVSVSGSISAGFTAIVMTVIAALFLQSFYDMLVRSLRREYDGPAEALVGVFELMWDHLQTMSTPEVWGALIVGGIVAGIITGYFGRIWR